MKSRYCLHSGGLPREDEVFMPKTAAVFLCIFWTIIGFAGSGQTKMVHGRPELKFREVYIPEPCVFFDFTQVLDRRQAIMASKVSLEEKVQRIVEVYQQAQHLLETPQDFERLMTSCSDKEVRMANDAFIRVNLDQFFIHSPTLDQIILLDRSVSTIETALAIKERGLTYCQSGQDFIKLILPNLHDDAPRAAKTYRAQLLQFMIDHVDDFKRLDPSPAEFIELKRHAILLDCENERADDITLSLQTNAIL